MNKDYYHRISKQKVNLIEDQRTIQFNYIKPKWCGYEFALCSELGCRSLFEEREKVSFNYCKTCDMFKP